MVGGNGLPGARLWRSRRPWGRCAGPAAPTRGCAARRHPLATSASAGSQRGSPWRAGKALMRRVELAVHGRRPVVAGSARSPCPRCGVRPGGPRAALRTWLRWARRPRGRRGRRTARRKAAPEGGRAGALRALTNDIQLQAVLRALLRAPSHCARARTAVFMSFQQRTRSTAARRLSKPASTVKYCLCLMGLRHAWASWSGERPQCLACLS